MLAELSTVYYISVVTKSGGSVRLVPPWPAILRTPVLLAGLSMLAGLDAALILLGVPAPVTTDRLPEVHGMVMALGFVGTLVCLERAVALARPVGYLAPALLGVGSLLLLAPPPSQSAAPSWSSACSGCAAWWSGTGRWEWSSTSTSPD